MLITKLKLISYTKNILLTIFSTDMNNVIITFTFLATSLLAIWNETLEEKYNYFQRHQNNIIYFRCTIAFWISSIIFGIGTSVYFYNNIGHRKRRDRESMFSNCIEQDSPVRTSSPVVQQGKINNVSLLIIIHII